MFSRGQFWNNFQKKINELKSGTSSSAQVAELRTWYNDALTQRKKQQLDISGLLSFVFSKDLTDQDRQQVVTLIDGMFSEKLADVDSIKLSDLLNMLAYENIQMQVLNIVSLLSTTNHSLFGDKEITCLMGYLQKIFSQGNSSDSLVRSIVNIISRLSDLKPACLSVITDLIQGDLVSSELLQRMRSQVGVLPQLVDAITPAYDRISVEVSNLVSSLKWRAFDEELNASIQTLKELIGSCLPQKNRFLRIDMAKLVPSIGLPEKQAEGLLLIVYQLLLKNIVSVEQFRQPVIISDLLNLVTHSSAFSIDVLVFGIFSHLLKSANLFYDEKSQAYSLILSIFSVELPKLRKLPQCKNYDEDQRDQIKKDVYSDVILILNSLILDYENLIKLNSFDWLSTSFIREEDDVVQAKKSLLNKLSTPSTVISKSSVVLDETKELIRQVTGSMNNKRGRNKIEEKSVSDDESIEECQPPLSKKSRTPPRPHSRFTIPSNRCLEDIDAPSSSQESSRSSTRKTPPKKPELQFQTKVRQSLPNSSLTSPGTGTVYAKKNDRRSSNSSVASNQSQDNSSKKGFGSGSRRFS